MQIELKLKAGFWQSTSASWEKGCDLCVSCKANPTGLSHTYMKLILLLCRAHKVLTLPAPGTAAKAAEGGGMPKRLQTARPKWVKADLPWQRVSGWAGDDTVCRACMHTHAHAHTLWVGNLRASFCLLTSGLHLGMLMGAVPLTVGWNSYHKASPRRAVLVQKKTVLMNLGSPCNCMMNIWPRALLYWSVH